MYPKTAALLKFIKSEYKKNSFTLNDIRNSKNMNILFIGCPPDPTMRMHMTLQELVMHGNLDIVEDNGIFNTKYQLRRK